MSIYEYWVLRDVDISNVCAAEVADRLFDESLESKRYQQNAVFEDDTLKLACAKCGHCVLRGMQLDASIDLNACITA